MHCCTSTRFVLPRVLVAAVLVNAPVRADGADFGLEDDGEYQRFLVAVRGAEYVRSDFITGQRKPRVYACLAGVMACAERNPLATDEQLSVYLDALEAHMSGFDPADPDLRRRASLLAALRFADIDAPGLGGIDTRVGERAVELLDLRVRPADGSNGIDRRMTDFEYASGRSLAYGPAIVDLLVGGLFGVDPASRERPGLGPLIADYLASQGMDPAIDTPAGRAELQSIDTAIQQMPQTFDEWDALRQAGYPSGGGVIDLRLMTEDAVAEVASLTDELIERISQQDPSDDAGLVESLESVENDPAYVEALLEELRDDLEASAAARAGASAATLLMFQNPPAGSDAGTFAEYQRGRHARNLEVNAAAANIRSGLRITSTVGLSAFALYSQDPVTSVGSLLTAGEDLFDLLGIADTGPSDTDLVRADIAELGDEMNDRFDRIDAQLNLMYGAIVAVLSEVANNGASIADLVADMAEVRSQLRRVESRLYGLLEAYLSNLFTNAVDTAINFFGETGSLLDYNAASINFFGTATFLKNFATNDSRLLASPDGELTLDTADELLGPEAQIGPGLAGEVPFAPRLNQIRLLTNDPELGLPPLATVDVPAIEPWTQAASAYAQLARENPWYFANIYRNQLNNANAGGSPPDLWSLIESGEEITGLLEAIRAAGGDGETVYSVLLDLQRDAIAELQTEIDAAVDAYFAARPAFRTADSAYRVEFWDDDRQLSTPTALIANDLEGLLTTPVFGIPDYRLTLPFKPGYTDKGYRSFHSIGAPSNPAVERTQLWTLLQQARHGADNFRLRCTSSVLPGGLFGYLDSWIGTEADAASSPIQRRIGFGKQYRVNSNPDFYVHTPFFSADDVLLSVWSVTQLNTNHFGDDFPDRAQSTPAGRQYFWDCLVGCDSALLVFDNSLVVDAPRILTDTQREFALRRVEIWNSILAALGPSDGSADTPLSRAADRLDDLEAALDVFVTLGMPDALRESTPLRSALRAVPGTSELGLRGDDIRVLVARRRDADQQIADGAYAWAEWGDDPSRMSPEFDVRIDAVESEIELALCRPVEYPGYLAWTLAELRSLRDTHTDPITGAPRIPLATDDTFVVASEQTLVVDVILNDDPGNPDPDTQHFYPVTGLLANDAEITRRPVTVDLTFDPGDAGYAAPLGDLLLGEDGSFTYTPPQGFAGDDRFTYRARVSFAGSTGEITVLSAPATVVVRVEADECLADLAEPFGLLDLADIVAFTTAFLAEQPAADLDGNGLYDLSDVTAFVTAFGAGCP